MKTIENLEKGETLLFRVRKSYKNAANPAEGFKPSLEIAEILDNGRGANAIAELNDDDDRFIQAKAQRAFQPVSLANAIAEGWITAEQFEKLEPSKDISVEDQKEGVHFITTNILNPKFKGVRLRVQVIESTSTTRKNADNLKKINPTNGMVVLSGGLPVYRIVQIAYEGNHASVYLPSDKATVTTTEKSTKPVSEVNY